MPEVLVDEVVESYKKPCYESSGNRIQRSVTGELN
jgi:hypothetical protein